MMINASSRRSDTSIEKVAFHVYRHSDLFNALGSAAIKARAGMLEPGDVIKLGRYEFVVDEDEMGENVVVHIILPKREIECMGEAASRNLGAETVSLNDKEISEWKGKFLDSLKSLLEKWQGIRCISGPGENLTFEKTTYRKESRDWR
jgi:hypothetical protein